MAMPFSAMEFSAPSRNYPPQQYDKWRLNLYRFNRSSTNNSVGEATGWAYTNGSAHEPDKFGVITFSGLMTDIQLNPKALVADHFVLEQNYPNPFNPTTTICYALPVAKWINLSVYDLKGRFIETLADGYYQAGEHKVTWTARGMASGVYFYRFTDGDFSETKKFLLQK